MSYSNMVTFIKWTCAPAARYCQSTAYSTLNTRKQGVFLRAVFSAFSVTNHEHDSVLFGQHSCWWLAWRGQSLAHLGRQVDVLFCQMSHPSGLVCHAGHLQPVWVLVWWDTGGTRLPPLYLKSMKQHCKNASLAHRTIALVKKGSMH